MSQRRTHYGLYLTCIFAAASGACSDDDAAPGPAAASTQSLQTPPMGAKALEAWLSKGSYKDWQCEPSVHESRSPSPHGFNRICSNDLVSNHADASDNWLSGAAAVKELFASADASTPIGYAVYLKTKADSAAGANWYWYERVPTDSAPPDGIVADGMGDSGTAKSICVGCHVAAGSDSDHTPSAGGRDEVYTPVQ
jgi:hypothetical protein